MPKAKTVKNSMIKEVKHDTTGIEEPSHKADYLYYDKEGNIIRTVERKYNHSTTNRKAYDHEIDVPFEIDSNEDKRRSYINSFLSIKGQITSFISELKLKELSSIDFKEDELKLTVTGKDQKSESTKTKTLTFKDNDQYKGLIVSQAIRPHLNENTKTNSLPRILRISLRDGRVPSHDANVRRGLFATGTSYDRLHNITSTDAVKKEEVLKHADLLKIAEYCDKTRDIDPEKISVEIKTTIPTFYPGVSDEKQPKDRIVKIIAGTQNPLSIKIDQNKNSNSHIIDTVVKMMGMFRPDYLDFLNARDLKNRLNLYKKVADKNTSAELVKVEKKRESGKNIKGAGARTKHHKSKYAVSFDDGQFKENKENRDTSEQNELFVSAFASPSMLLRSSPGKKGAVDPTFEAVFRRDATNNAVGYYHYNFMEDSDIWSSMDTMFGSQHASSELSDKAREKLKLSDLKKVVEKFYGDIDPQVVGKSFDELYDGAIGILKTKNSDARTVEMEPIASNFAQMAFFYNEAKSLEALASTVSNQYEKIKTHVAASKKSDKKIPELANALASLAIKPESYYNPKTHEGERLASLAPIVAKNSKVFESGTSKFEDLRLSELANTLDSRIKDKLNLVTRSQESIIISRNEYAAKEGDNIGLVDGIALTRYDTRNETSDIKSTDISGETTSKNGLDGEAHHYRSKEKGSRNAVVRLVPHEYAVLREEGKEKRITRKKNIPETDSSFDFEESLRDIIGAIDMGNKELLQVKLEVFQRAINEYCSYQSLLENSRNPEDVSMIRKLHDKSFKNSFDHNADDINRGPDFALYEACIIMKEQISNKRDFLSTSDQDQAAKDLVREMVNVRLNQYSNSKDSDSEERAKHKDKDAYFKSVNKAIDEADDVARGEYNRIMLELSPEKKQLDAEIAKTEAMIKELEGRIKDADQNKTPSPSTSNPNSATLERKNTSLIGQTAFL